MAVSRYTGALKRRTNVLSGVTPSPVVQRDTANPAGEWMPAAWLPIEWTDTVTQDSFVISSGKVVSIDRSERIVPSGYRLRTTIGSTFVTYTTADVTEGVIDIVTGVAVTAAGVRTAQAVATALLARGLVTEAELALGHVYSAATQGDVTAVLEAFISMPIGIMVGDCYVWAGDWPDLHFANYQKQHLIQFVTELQMKVPHLALTAAATSGNVAVAGLTPWVAASGDGEAFPDGGVAADELGMTSTVLSTLTRYSGQIAAGDNVFGIGLQFAPICKNTTRTPITSSANLLLTEKASIATLTTAGDYYVDREVGIILVFAAGGAASPAGAGETITFYHYLGGTAAAHRMVHLCDEARPGQFLTVDNDSNFVATDITPGVTNMGGIVGRVYRLISEPKGLLERVETAWSASNMAVTERMPGTATAGYTDLITFSAETVADQIAILNIKIS